MCSDTNEDYSIYNQINKTKFGSLPFTIRNPNSIAEADRTPGIESPVGGRSHIRKVPSDHNTNTHTLIGDGRKFYRFSPHLFVVFLCLYCVLTTHSCLVAFHPQHVAHTHFSLTCCILHTQSCQTSLVSHQIHVMCIYW